jgi:RNA polymerase sigma factor (sigma-70 family)
VTALAVLRSVVADFDPEAALTRAAAGDQGAWTSIVGAYSGLVWSVARSFGLSRADAGDVYQGTWLRLVEHLGDLRDGSRLGGWLATTARREALTMIRRAHRSVVVDTVDMAANEPVGSGPGVDEQLITTEEHRTLWTAFQQLSAACQRLLRIQFADPPPSYGEISAALNMPIGSIGPTRARCLGNLHSLLDRSGGERT